MKSQKFEATLTQRQIATRMNKIRKAYPERIQVTFEEAAAMGLNFRIDEIRSTAARMGVRFYYAVQPYMVCLY